MTPITLKAFKTLKYLEGITLDLREYSYSHVKQVLHSLPQMAMPTAIVNKDWSIQRGMRNYNGEIFTSQSRISCISDEKLLHKIDRGRANLEGQPIFYGSVYSSLIPDQEYTCLSEISPILKYPANTPDNKEPEVYTVGNWRIKKPFEVVEVVFSEEAIATNPDVKQAFENQVIKVPLDKNPEYFIRKLKLISTDFAKLNIRNMNEYNLSCAYSNIVYNQQRFAGITYPSVRTQYRSNNIALIPEALKFIELESVKMYKVLKRGKKALIMPFMECTALGIEKDSFQWAPLEGSLSNEAIEDFFKHQESEN